MNLPHGGGNVKKAPFGEPFFLACEEGSSFRLRIGFREAHQPRKS